MLLSCAVQCCSLLDIVDCNVLCYPSGFEGWPACSVPLVDPSDIDPDIVHMSPGDFDSIPPSEVEVCAPTVPLLTSYFLLWV